MNKLPLVLMLIVITLLAGPVYASVQYRLGVDDYADLFIDGQLVAHYDASAEGGVGTDVLDLSTGWHDIDIVFKNRWGSSTLSLLTYDQDPSTYTLVPLEDFQSMNEQGDLISGLTAEYYTLTGDWIKTIYGEGPIAHVSGSGPTRALYQNVRGETWVGLWDTFEERLSGEIYVAAPIPAPGALVLGSMGIGIVGWLRKRRAL